MNQFFKKAFIAFGVVLVSLNAHAESIDTDIDGGAKKLADELYMPTPQVVPEQSQLTYYYPNSINAGPLNIYIDKEFVTALLPGEFISICINEGPHYMNAVVNDAPLFRQKEKGGVYANFAGGKTYFARVGARDEIVSESVYRKEAEQELQGFKKNTRIINRASAVGSCRYIGSAADVMSGTNSVLFKFGGSSYAKIEPESKETLTNLIQRIKDSGNINEIDLIGYADSIGKAESNRRLSKARANTVRHLMIEAGIDGSIINVKGEGVAESSSGCSSNPNAGCNKQSRRVDIQLNGN